MHVLWIHEVAAFTGGCERYVSETVSLLQAHGVRSSLLYDPNQPTDPQFLRGFDAAFPMVDLLRQVHDLAPDVLYVHKLAGIERMQAVIASGVPAARFYHDHILFCPRAHKYTAFGKRTCTSAVGAGCFACAGCLVRTEQAPGLGVSLPSALLREQRVNHGLSAFVVGSRYMADHLALHGFPTERIHRIPLYIHPPAEAAPPAGTSSRDPDLFVFAGQLITGKGVDTLLEALALLAPPARALILGAGRFEARYRALADQLGVSDRVTFAGKVGAAELSEAYQRAGAVVTPSRTPETFGLVGAEALGHGAPVIATDVGGVGEWLQDGVTGLAVPPNDPQALSRAMARLQTDRDLANRLGDAGRRHVVAHLGPGRHVATLLALFRSLASAPAAVPGQFRPAAFPAERAVPTGLADPAARDVGWALPRIPSLPPGANGSGPHQAGFPVSSQVQVRAAGGRAEM